MKVRLCVKLFDFFFRGSILIRLTWNLSLFVPNSVEILTWNFRKKLFRENFSQIFAQTKAIIYQKLWNFDLLSAIFILRSYCAEKNSHKYFHMLFAPRYGGTSINESQKEDTGKKSQDIFFGKPVFFTLGLGLTTTYSLGVFVWNFYQMFVTVSIEFSLKFEPQIRPTRLTINFLLITVTLKGRFVPVWNCLIFFRGSILIRLTWICHVLSRIQWRF